MAEQKSPTWKIPSRLRSNARALRKNSTNAERILWYELRDHRLNGASFRRQVPIANYIADFVCHSANLVIELDGGQHFSNRAEQADARRSAAIEAKGFQVLRFSNHDVITNLTGVLEAITAAVAATASTLTLRRKRQGCPGKIFPSRNKCLQQRRLWKFLALSTRDCELESFESLESVPRTALRKRGRGQEKQTT